MGEIPPRYLRRIWCPPLSRRQRLKSRAQVQEEIVRSESVCSRRIPRRAAEQAGRLMRRLADATRPLIRQHARDHAKRAGRVSCRCCAAALRAVQLVEDNVLAGDYFV